MTFGKDVTMRKVRRFGDTMFGVFDAFIGISILCKLKGGIGDDL